MPSRAIRVVFLFLIFIFSAQGHGHVLPAAPVGPPGSLPHFLTYHGDDHPGGQLPASDVVLTEWIPDLAAFPTRIATSGRWSQIWGGSPPGPSDVVLIPSGVVVSYDMPLGSTVKTIGVQGTLVFDPSVNVQMKVGTIFVYDGGVLLVKPDGTVRHEIIFSGALNSTEDPGQWALGIVTIGGIVDIAGSYVPQPYAKYQRAVAGEQTITLAQAVPSGWRIGDELFLAGSISTRLTPPPTSAIIKPSTINFERVRISNINGAVITLEQPLQYTHQERIDVVARSGVAGFDTYRVPREPGMVAHVTRNVMIRSEQTGILSQRGHILFSGNTSVSVVAADLRELGRTTNSQLRDVRRFKNGTAYAGPVFSDAGCGSSGCSALVISSQVISLGDRNAYPGKAEVPSKGYGQLASNEYMVIETVNISGANQRGRYALHAHHPHQPFLFEDNVVSSIDMDMRWGIVNHNAHGIIKNNVVLWRGGSAIVTEYGTETGQIIDNLVIGLQGGTGETDGDRLDAQFGNRISVYDFGQGGFGYWFGGREIEVQNNYADGLFQVGAFDYYVKNYGRQNERPITKPELPYSSDFLPLTDGVAPELAGRYFNSGKMNTRLFDGAVSYAFSDFGFNLIDEWAYSLPGNVLHNVTLFHGGTFMGGENSDKIIDTVRMFGWTQNYGGTMYMGTGVRHQANVDKVIILNSHIEQFQDGVTDRAFAVFVENTTFVNVNNTFLSFGVVNEIANDFSAPTPLTLRDVRVQQGKTSSNLPPTVTMTSPFERQIFTTTSPVQFQAQASDSDGQVVKVEFYQGEYAYNPAGYQGSQYSMFPRVPGVKLGEDTNGADGWSFSWNAPSGLYDVSVRAYDDDGAMAFHGQIPVEVLFGGQTQPVFYRAIDLERAAAPGGTTPSTIDGHLWESSNAAPDFSHSLGDNNPVIAPLNPPATGTFEEMLRSVLPSGYRYVGSDIIPANITFTNVPAGAYYVYVYETEAWDRQEASIMVNGKVVDPYFATGLVGSWMKRGPYLAIVNESTLVIKFLGRYNAAARLFISGVELYALGPGSTNQPPRVRAFVDAVDGTNPAAVRADLRALTADTGSVGVHWELLSVPDYQHSPLYFENQSAASTRVWLFQPGTYIFQAVADDGIHAVTSNTVSVTVPPLYTTTSSDENAYRVGATFFKGYNVNGPPLTVEGRLWDGSATLIGPLWSNTTGLQLPLSRDAGLRSMLQTGVVFGTNSGVGGATMSSIPSGIYQVYAYTYSPALTYPAFMMLNGQMVHWVQLYNNGQGNGTWRKHGPFTIPIVDGTLRITGQVQNTEPLPVLAGVELWRVPDAPPSNTAPRVDTGGDRTLAAPLLTLVGRARDDGRPNRMTSSWSMLSGPGTVSFSHPTSPLTTASFSATGAYLLRLTTSDGQLSGSDTLSITIGGATTGPPRLLALDADGTRALSGQLSFLDRGTGANLAMVSFTTNATGHFLFDLPAGLPAAVDIKVTIPGYLWRMQRNADSVTNSTVSYQPALLLAGDFNQDSSVNTLDWSTMNRNWFNTHPLADINRDGTVNSLDFSFLSKNWLRHGE